MSITLRIDPPLPCGTLTPTDHDPRRRCGQLARVAQADQLGGGDWLLMPICRDCVAAMARTYGVTPDASSEEAL